jgi:hypothetical protein
LHPYFELVERSARLALHTLKEAEDQVPQMGGTTAAVKTLQAIRLQKAIIAVGMFSMLESILQDRLKSKNGFSEARRCLKAQKEVALEKRFSQFNAAINVLKHGLGESYEALLKHKQLPFRIKHPGDAFFFEGDASEVTTLVDVDNKFVMDCAQLIRDVSNVVREVHPGAAL